jgi:release factor glutamine methyltransferase
MDASRPMTAGAAIGWAAMELAVAGVPMAYSDAAVLLQWAANMPATRFRADPGIELTGEEFATFAAWVARRSHGEPVAYITGHKSFMGLDLEIDKRVLIVRPLTRLVAEVALELARLHPKGSLIAADIGTGVGALAIALAVLEPRFERIYGSDYSADALEVARANGARYGLDKRIVWLEGDLLEPIPEPVDLMVANLPYVPQPITAPAVEYEPHVAFYGGDDGLELLRRFSRQLPAKLRPGGAVVLEIGPDQRSPVEAALLEHSPALLIEYVPDNEKILIAELPA